MKWLVALMVMLLFLAVPVYADDHDEDDKDEEDKKDRRAAFGGFARVIHASPDAPAVDVKLDGDRAITNLAFTKGTDYVKLPRGTYNAQVVPAGTDTPVVIDADIKVRPFRLQTIVAVNTLDSIEPLVLKDRIRFVNKNKALLRFVHASPDAPAVDIAVKDGPVLIKGAEFKDATKYLKVQKGTYDLEVRVAGTDTVALEVPGVDLSGRTAYTVFAMGQLSEGTLQAVPFVDGKWTRRGYQPTR